MPSRSSVPLRQQLLIERSVQGPILQRTVLYSTACAVYFMVILFFTESISAPEEHWSETLFRCLDVAVYWAPGLMLLTPVIAYDILTLTNRFAGPIFRLRREMRRLADGESANPLNFRDGDYWTEMADVFNVLRDELMELRESRMYPNQTHDDATPDVASYEKLFTDEDGEDPTDDLLVESNG